MVNAGRTSVTLMFHASLQSRDLYEPHFTLKYPRFLSAVIATIGACK